MSENAWSDGPERPEEDPTVDRPVAHPPAFSVAGYVERQEAELDANGPTMADWLAGMHRLDWGSVDSDDMIHDVREWRDAG